MKFDFKGKIIIITGSTRGIGKKIAEDLFLLGATLILTGTNKEEVEKLNNFKRPNVKYYYLDNLKKKSVDSFIEDISDLDLIHGLVNNAGINRLNSVQNVNLSDWNDMVSVNLTTPFRLIKAVSSKMISNNYGRILNIASIFSVISKEKRVAYSSTKFGLNGLTIGTSNDVSKYNILCNSLSPGFVMTDLTKKNLSKKEIKELSSQIPIKKFGTTSDISNVAVFLLSDLNQYITGQNIIADGGYTNV
jgi:3-oxoacyl-[acyl-carrier protein] reductase